jgi:uroporphyrinogen-III synthase
MPAIVQKGASESDMIEGLQLVILEKIEARLTALERVGIGPPLGQRGAAETGKKAAPEASPAQSNGLVGRRILVTAPSTYAARLAGQVLARGGRPVCMPTIVTEPLQEQEHGKLDAALRAMASASGSQPAFAYIAFTSRNGIEAFLRRAAVLGLAADLSGLLRGCTVCALGNDAKMLEQAGIEVGLLPTVSSPKGIIDELAERGEAGLGRAILVPVPEVTGVPEPPVVPNFVAGLNKLGMAVHRCVHRVSNCAPYRVCQMRDCCCRYVMPACQPMRLEQC